MNSIDDYDYDDDDNGGLIPVALSMRTWIIIIKNLLKTVKDLKIRKQKSYGGNFGIMFCKRVILLNPTLVFSCEYCKVFKNSCFYRTPLTAPTLLKRFQRRCFSGNIAKIYRTPVLKNICERLLLKEFTLIL